jgi:hypothetical protein
MDVRRKHREIELKTAQPAVVPQLSEGVALATLLAFHRRTSASTNSRTRHDFYGDRARAPDPPNLLGAGHEDIARRIFGGQISGWDVLMRHTLFGFYSRLLTQSATKNWAEDLANCRRISMASYLDISTGPLSSLGASGALRKCYACIDSDLAQGEIPGWKLLHQLPFLSHCVDHSQHLVSICPSCSHAFERGADFRLPSDPCMHCGCAQYPARTPELCRGQLLLGRLCSRVFSGLVPDLEPSRWVDWVNATNAEFGNAGIAVASVERHLVELWGVKSTAEISSVLGYTLPGDFVSQELELAMSSRIWLSRLLVYSAVGSLMNKNPISRNSATEELSEVNDRFDLLARLAAASAIPQGVIDRLVAGDAVSAVIGARTVTIGRLRRFLRSLPGEISNLLQKNGKNGRQQRRADSPLKETKHDELLAVSRQALLDAKAGNADLTRTEAANLFPSRYRWLTRHDSEWLAAELPSLLPSSEGVQGWFSYFDNDEERRQAYQHVVLEFLQHKPEAGRSEVYKEQRRAMKWLLQNERAWCDVHVPFRAKSHSSFEWYRGTEPLVLPKPILKSRYRDDDERTALSKTYVLEMRALNPHLLRSELVRACYGSINWLRHRDSGWLEEHLPPTVRHRKKK